MTAEKMKPRWWSVLAAATVLAPALIFVAYPPTTYATWLGALGLKSRSAHANFLGQTASPHVRQMAEQIMATADHLQRPFLLVDKVNARLFVFNPDGKLRANSAILLGAAHGDDSVPGIGQRAIADIQPFERTTPAGKFLAEAGRNANGEDIVWVDYDAAISMHRVRTHNSAEQRLQRLATPTVEDNRISYGCINVPAKFFDEYVDPIFRTNKSYVYVLPEVKVDSQVFHWPLTVGTPIAAR